MTNLQKMEEWLMANLSETDVERYLVLWYARFMAELSQDEIADEIENQIANPLTYESLAAMFLEDI